jgi:hypothetical protein
VRHLRGIRNEASLIGYLSAAVALKAMSMDAHTSNRLQGTLAWPERGHTTSCHPPSLQPDCIPFPPQGVRCIRPDE